MVTVKVDRFPYQAILQKPGKCVLLTVFIQGEQVVASLFSLYSSDSLVISVALSLPVYFTASSRFVVECPSCSFECDIEQPISICEL